MRHVAVILLVALAIACEHQVTAYPPQGALLSRAVGSGQIPNLTVHFVSDVDDILKACPELTGGTYYGCAKQDVGRCDVWFQEPTDFNDVPRLATMGHELLHCMGATHAKR